MRASAMSVDCQLGMTRCRVFPVATVSERGNWEFCRQRVPDDCTGDSEEQMEVLQVGKSSSGYFMQIQTDRGLYLTHSVNVKQKGRSFTRQSFEL